MKSQLPTKQVNKWIRFSQVGLQMAVTIFICCYLGVWLDEKFLKLAPLFTVLCSLLGVFAAIYKVIMQVKSLSDDSL